MAADINFAVRQVRRMKGLTFFPTDDVAVEELAVWLARHAPSDEDIEAFINLWLATNPEAPKPVDIYDHFHPPAAFQEFGTPAEVRCQICGDTGFRIIQGKSGATGAIRCECQGVMK